MLKLLRRWLGWDSGSGLFDFKDLETPPRTRVPPSAPKPPPAAQKPSDAGARPAAQPQQRQRPPAKSRPERKDDVLEILDNPKLTLDRPASAEDGFDPYNTGAFNRSQSWEKISRKR